MHARIFGCFHNPPKSDMDYRNFDVHNYVILLHAYAYRGPQFAVSVKGLLKSLYRTDWRNLEMGNKA